MKKNKSVHLDSNYSSTKRSWLGTDLRNLNGLLHHFDFANLDPTVADININLGGYDYGDIYHEIGQKLDYLFSRFELNICFSDNMYTDELGEKFLILNHDCAFSYSKDNLETGEHWKVTDQRWKVSWWDIFEGHYYGELPSQLSLDNFDFYLPLDSFIVGWNHLDFHNASLQLSLHTRAMTGGVDLLNLKNEITEWAKSDYFDLCIKWYKYADNKDALFITEVCDQLELEIPELTFDLYKYFSLSHTKLLVEKKSLLLCILTRIRNILI